jgi:hypothetical protein
MGSQALLTGLVAGLALSLLLALCALGGMVKLWRDVGRVRLASRALEEGGLHGLDQVLRELDLHLRQVVDRTTELERRMVASEQGLNGAIQRVKVLRFNPFRDTGGDQSFVIALLDAQGSGIVVTGLHSRAETRVYAKPVSGGSSQFPLSDEEIAVIRSAVAPVGREASR